jgi:hypothetical protein
MTEEQYEALDGGDLDKQESEADRQKVEADSPSARSSALRTNGTSRIWLRRLSACGRALKPWLWRTLLPAAVLDPSGQASPAERQPCRTAGAGFTAARVLGRGRRRA